MQMALYLKIAVMVRRRAKYSGVKLSTYRDCMLLYCNVTLAWAGGAGPLPSHIVSARCSLKMKTAVFFQAVLTNDAVQIGPGTPN